MALWLYLNYFRVQKNNFDILRFRWNGPTWNGYDARRPGDDANGSTWYDGPARHDATRNDATRYVHTK
jgi:hypothetical protein